MLYSAAHTFLKERQRHDQCEEIIVTQTDPDEITVISMSTQQLVVIGLLNRRSNTEGVLIFDFLSRKWLLGADMPCSRYLYAYAASQTEGLVYIVGGCDRWTFSPSHLEGFVYNVEENKWGFLPPMNSDPLVGLCSGVFHGDKFYVVFLHSQRAQVYDPQTRLWKNINLNSYKLINCD
ncbi:hypothetical protein SUGI_0244530 [Cryptomeria japonica]|nr:hypothetical protein SUGI_0244530 [Cryptomeria japonica]